jgi:hypothetical protein
LENPALAVVIESREIDWNYMSRVIPISKGLQQYFGFDQSTNRDTHPSIVGRF